MSIVIEPDYGYVLAASVLLGLQLTLTNFSCAGPRYRHFSADYIKKELSKENEEFKKAFGSEMSPGCHPDPGLGRLSDKLSLEAWFEINTAMRAAGNFLENHGQFQVALLIAGLGFPKVAALLGLAQIVGRFLYSTGIRSKAGPNKRGPGFGICMLSYFGVTGLALFTAVRQTGLLG